MPYNLDLSAITVQEYKELLKGQNLLPGRRILWNDIDSVFETIGKQGIHTVAQLKNQLSTRQKILVFTEATNIPEEYLMVLKREVGSFDQKPLALSDFPGIDAAVVADLNNQGIKTTKDYIERDVSPVGELLGLCDLVRINGVGAVAARAFYEAGYQSVGEVARADAATMLEKITEVNNINHYYKAQLGIKDMQFCIDYASLLVRYGAER
jgi:hypothetical protein